MSDSTFTAFLTLGQTETPASAAATPPAKTVEVIGLPPGASVQPTAQPGGAATPTATGVTPAGAVPPAAPRAGGMDMSFYIMMGGLVLFMVLMSVFSGRKDKKKREELMSSIAPKDKVQTIGGIIGTVVEIDASEVLLRVDENTNTRIRFNKAAISQVIRKANAPAPAAEAEIKGGAAKVPA